MGPAGGRSHAGVLRPLRASVPDGGGAGGPFLHPHRAVAPGDRHRVVPWLMHSQAVAPLGFASARLPRRGTRARPRERAALSARVMRDPCRATSSVRAAVVEGPEAARLSGRGGADADVLGRRGPQLRALRRATRRAASQGSAPTKWLRARFVARSGAGVAVRLPRASAPSAARGAFPFPWTMTCLAGHRRYCPQSAETWRRLRRFPRPLGPSWGRW